MPITYLALTQDQLSEDKVKQFLTEKDCRIQYVGTIQELFNRVNDLAKPLDIVVACGEFLHNIGGRLSVLEVVNAIQTMLSCVRPQAKFAIGVRTDISTEVIKLIKSLPVRYYLPAGPGFTMEEKFEAFDKMMALDSYTPGSVNQIFRSIKPRRDSEIKVDLTPRQSQILDIIVKRGASNKAIARMLNITESTVKLHMSGILKKYGVRNRTQLALFARDKALA